MWSTELGIRQQILRCLHRYHALNQTTSTIPQPPLWSKPPASFPWTTEVTWKCYLLSLTTTKTHPPHSSLNDLLKARTRLPPISGFLLHTDWNPNSLLQPIRPFGTWFLHTSSLVFLAHHTPGTLAFLLFVELINFFSTSKIFTIIGDNNNELYLLNTNNVPGVT